MNEFSENVSPLLMIYRHFKFVNSFNNLLIYWHKKANLREDATVVILRW